MHHTRTLVAVASLTGILFGRPFRRVLGGILAAVVCWIGGGSLCPAAAGTEPAEPAGLVAAYGFDEGSGTTAADASGNGNDGTVSGAVWVTLGHSGSALAFDGASSLVTVADADTLDLTAGMTLSAWVNPTETGGFRTVLLKENDGALAYALYADDEAHRPAGYGRQGTTSLAAQGVEALPLNVWTHLAVTYDGANLLLYANGIEAGRKAMTESLNTSTLPLRIGGNHVWGEYFSGLIDEVRVYKRALSATEIQSVMTRPITPPLTDPVVNISSPTSNAAVVGPNVKVLYTVSGNLTEAWEVHFRLDGGPELVDSSIDGQYQLTNVAIGSHILDCYLVRRDQSKIAGSDAPTASILVSAHDTVRPTVAMLVPRDGDTLSGDTTLSAFAADNLGLGGVQFKLDGKPLGAEVTAAPYNYAWNTREVGNGVHVLTAVARDAADNIAESRVVNVIVYNAPTAPAGLVAAYGFDEGGGTIAADGSGNGHDGNIAGARWVTQGHSGGGLSFNGIDNLVTVADAESLDLTNGITLSAWVNPTETGGWQTVVLKESKGDLAYGLYASDDQSRPAGYGRYRGGSVAVTAAKPLPTKAWSHLALTYDGAFLRLYINGHLVGSRAKAGRLLTSARPLRIGGNKVWGEYFSGLIDEVRIYNRALGETEVQSVMRLPVTISAPTRSSPIAVDGPGRRVWVANPDNDSVSVLDADRLALKLEVPVGKHPTSVALDRFGQVWVTCRDDDSIWILNALDGAYRNTLNLPWGSAPVSVVFSPDGANGYLGLYGSGKIQSFAPATQTLDKSLALGTTPRALGVTADGKRLLVSQFISTESQGMVRTVQLDTLTEGPALPLPLDTTSQDGSVAARGLPNYLAGIAIDPGNSLAWVVGQKDNILRGLFRDGRALTFETTVRALVSPLELSLNQETTGRRRDLDNLSQPSAIALSETGTRLFVTLQGNNALVVLNQLGREITRAETGLAPQGVAIDSATNRVFTQDFMGRTVSVFDGSAVITQSAATLPRLAQIRTIGTEKLTEPVLRGKRIFYNAADTRMSREGYLSCASCHLDGDSDGQVWDFTDRGEGLRNTTSLRGQGGHATAPFHWTGNFDEVQDFENDVRNSFGGTGFMSDADYFAGTRRLPLGDPKAGLSQDLDDLAAYLDSLVETGRSPRRDGLGALTAAAEAGKLLFESLGCRTCHGSERFNDPNPGSRHDVGTIKTSSGQRLGAPLDGLDTPTLAGLWATAPYLHDGSANTVKDVLTTANPDGRHADASALSPDQLDQLVDYLMQIEYGP